VEGYSLEKRRSAKPKAIKAANPASAGCQTGTKRGPIESSNFGNGETKSDLPREGFLAGVDIEGSFLSWSDFVDNFRQFAVVDRFEVLVATLQLFEGFEGRFGHALMGFCRTSH
tara:strand:+ start:606 stop:947 length:342 start_codon:yes stop_codon:yes gene_type:complete